ncbi:MAG TPA: inositol-3-phosphate synthase [Myxococcaceae bacterium]|nr:inositol-3-phosphate synthase [Myxococcaceae bacterium]
MSRLGVCFVGAGGAVASTVIAGVALMKRGLAPRIGMVTETGGLPQTLGCAPLDSMVFGGWDIRDANLFEVALRERIVPEQLLRKVEPELRAIKPWPGVVSPRFLGAPDANHVVTAKSHREELEILTRNVKDFKAANKLDRLIIVNLGSTERHAEVSDVHRTLGAFEAGLSRNDERISPAMKYLYLACKLGAGHVNFTPSLTKVPALESLAETAGIPIAGEDGKTGQTLLKTALAPAFAVRQLKVSGWFSTNILGNNDGRVLDDPESNKTKVASKLSVLDEILGYEVADHQVHINYYRPRGDEKEAWDNIDVLGFLGERMQIKINFLCKDSILAAPLVVDLVRLMDVAQRCGERGIQRQFSLFFKAPYHREGERAVNDLFKQAALLQEWVEKVARRVRAAV